MFKPRPYDPARWRKRTPAQQKAIQRNFLIFRLRGFYAQTFMLTGKRRERAQRIIDQELQAMGAEPETVRQARRRREYEAEMHRQQVINDLLKSV